MGILGKVIETTVKTAAKKSIIKTAGSVATTTAITILDRTENNRKRKNENSFSLFSQSVDNGVKKQQPLFIDDPNYILFKSADPYINKSVTDVRSELIALGFKNITFWGKKDITSEWVNKDGAVFQIVINGTCEFNKKTKFSPNASVVVHYHTFKNKPSPYSPEKLFVYLVETEKRVDNNIEQTISDASIVFCTECGTKQESTHNFCFVCGNRLKHL